MSTHDEEVVPPKKKRKNLFDLLYNMNSGKEITEDDRKAPRNFTFFFKLLWRNLGRIFYSNLLFIGANFPLIIIALFPAKVFHTAATSPSSPLFLPMFGASEFGASSPDFMTLWGVFGNSASIYIPTTLSWIVLAIGILLLLFTFGPVSIGISYVLRNVVRGEPIFLWKDFWYALKKNLRQGLIIGIIDLFLSFMLVYDLFFCFRNLSDFTSGIMFWATVFMILVYFVMRFYIYLLTLTFDLKIWQIFKNALIFAFLGFRRNFLAFIGILLTVFINAYVFVLYLPIGIVLPLIITVGICIFISVYAAWPKIKEIMIDPYEEAPEPDEL